ncbi:MAG: transcriptional regulator [Chlamydiota bacterium]|nr:transcriptional regulator [Chlamydiota bacterium]
MSPRTQELIHYFKKHGGILRFADILKAGFHPDSLAAIEKAGEVEKIAWGLYRVVNYKLGSHPDLVIASLQSPKGAICLISALSFHEATSEIPRYVDIAIPQGTHANRIKYPPVKFYRFDSKSWKTGLQEYEMEGCKIRIYNLAKSIVDCFKFRNRIGVNIAREALKVGITEKRAAPKEIMKYAKICRVSSIIKPILETMI